jgi:hypothetical protein
MNKLLVLYILGLVVGCTVFSSHGFVLASIREQLKGEILQLAKETKKGLDATPEQQRRMLTMFETLEKFNPTWKPLLSNKINGVWDLQYTASESILGKGGYPRIGPIQQMIDATTRTAYNAEVVNYFGVVPVPRKVEAELTPVSGQFTNVQFKKFYIGPVCFDAPEQFKGALDITYLDDTVRLTRGDKGNIFVLTREAK